MNYPLISEYIESIRAAEDNFAEHNYLRPVLDDAGNPVMSSGNFAVVFKMRDERFGKLHAVKCFLKEQEGRADAYRMIAEELEFVSSTFLIPIKYLEKELFVDTNASDETEFPVLLMDWVEGITLDKYIREHIDDQYELSLLAYQFSRLAMWLMPQPFAHGDLKPDNILIREDGTLVLVDYDGMYVPAMKGQEAREIGSPDFRHPSRYKWNFDNRIDDFSLVSILFSLKAISLQPNLLEQYGASDRLLFSEKDYRNIANCVFLKKLFPSDDIELNCIYGLFLLYLSMIKITNQSIESLVAMMDNNLWERAYLFCHGTKHNKTKYWKEKPKEEFPIMPDKEKAYRLFRDLAVRGSVRAQSCMGCILWNRESVLDKQLSLFWYSQAAKSGDHKAIKDIQEIGKKYFDGNGVKRDYKEAFHLFQLAANYGVEEAMMMLAFCYENGIGTSKNESLALEWYNKLQNGDSAYSLGIMYFEGNNVEIDIQKGLYWFNKSIDMGCSKGYSFMYFCYDQGYGIPLDKGKANSLVKLISNAGLDDLIRILLDQEKYEYCVHLFIVLQNILMTKLGEGWENLHNVNSITDIHSIHIFRKCKKILVEKGFLGC